MINYKKWSIAGWFATPGARIRKKQPVAKLHVWLRSRGDIVFFRLCAGDPLKAPGGFVSVLPMMPMLIAGIDLEICSNCQVMLLNEGHEISDAFEALGVPNNTEQDRLYRWLINIERDGFAELPFALSFGMDELLEKRGK